MSPYSRISRWGELKQSSADFEPERYADEYRERALAMIEKKVEGQEIKPAPSTPARRGNVVDIFAKLKQSLAEAKPPRQASAAKKKRKA